MQLQHRLPLSLGLTLLLLAPLGCGRGGKIAEREATALSARIERVEKGLLQRHPMSGEESATIEERMALLGVSGVALAVIQDFEVAWSKGYGLADSSGRAMGADTLVQAGDLSMAVSAAVALALADAGQLSLDGPIAETLTSWQPADNGLTAEAPLTLRHLLSHSGGVSGFTFPGYPLGGPAPTLRQVETGGPPSLTPAIQIFAPPGAQIALSAGGFVVVQQAIEDASGQSLEAVARARLFEPLGMAASRYEQPLNEERRASAAVGHGPRGEVIEGGFEVYPELGATGLWTTAADLARFGAGVQRAIRGRGDGFLTPATAQALATDQGGGAGLGLGLVPFGNALYLRKYGTNAGFNGMMILHRDNGYGAVVLTNSQAAGRLVEEVVRAVAAEYSWEGYLNPPVDWTPLPAAGLDAYAGRYELEPDRILRLAREGDRLMAYETTRELPDPVFPLEGSTLYRQLFNVRLDFELDGEGRAAAYSFAGPDDTVITRSRLLDGTPLPAELLLDGRIDEAIAAYRREEIANPVRLNAFGYDLLARGRLNEAVALFALNTELFPASPNAWDSLAEGYLEAGDRERAAATYRKALEVLAADPRIPPPQRQFGEDNARRHLAWIEAWGR